MMKFLLLALVVSFSSAAFAQSLGIGEGTPDIPVLQRHGPPLTGALLMDDNVSYILQDDNVSKICLTGATC